MSAPAPWLDTLLSRVRGRAGPVVIEADPRWGVPHLIAALNAPQQPLIWCDLAPADADDPVAQGNKLAEAVRRALVGAHDHAPLLFGYGMPYRYGLSVLRQHLELLGPFTFALLHAEYGPALARDLLEFQRDNNRVVLHFNRLPDGFSLPAHALLLGPGELRMSQAEALALVDGKLTGDEALALWQLADGAYEPFMVALHERLSLPLPLRPSPEGSRPIPGLEPEPRPAQLLEILWRQGRYLEALELAVQHAPEEVPQVLTEAGDYFWERGLEARVYALLEKLSQPFRRLPVVLGYRLVAALTLGQEKALLYEVAAALAEQDLPDLRALYAEALFEQGDSEGYLAEAERAARARETPQTLYTYGRALGLRDPEAGLALLEQGLRLAEHEGKALLAVTIADALASRQSLLGRYRSAVYWAEWGQRLYRQSGLSQISLRLGLLNEWAYARILQGGAAGLELELRAEVHNLVEVRPSLSELFQTTLADLLLSQGEAAEAAAIYRVLWQENQRRERVGALANLLVRALLEVGEEEEALAVAEQAQELTRGLEPLRQRRARLACGMALSFSNPGQAVPILEGVLSDFSQPLLAERLAQAGFYLARAYLLTGQPEQARTALARAEMGLSELGESGLRHLAGPAEAFYEVKRLLKGEQHGLELSFFETAIARLNGKPLSLRPRFAELLLALSLHPQGLSGEQLTLAVYGEYGDVQRCAVEIGRLRKLVPVTSRPYRLGVSVTADFLKLGELVQNNRLLEALELYRGPLLPGSEAPSVVEKRVFLEEALRQAILRSQDPEALWMLAERLVDDLEVWEKVLTLLDKSDPRTAVARARVRGLVDSYDA
ncbi:MAG: helix-turn-helix domain-containing protein [Truepera sp.]|nr:helix-turn-helix domain-containing protein [Truepera sp.]